MRLRLLLLIAALQAPAGLSAQSFNPASEYITAGQDEAGYREWLAKASWRPVYVKAFNDYLAHNGVGGVAPTWQLLRTATDWQKCSAEPFEVPPTSSWPNIVAALRYVGAFVEPVVGPVEPVSVYRNPQLNNCAGGAKESTHRTLGAIDMVPLLPISREELMTRLCRTHLGSGTWNSVGLGFYKGLRFHIDAKKFREWGTAGAHGGWGCAAVMAEGARPHQPAPDEPSPASPLPTSPGLKLITAPQPDPLAPR